MWFPCPFVVRLSNHKSWAAGARTSGQGREAEDRYGRNPRRTSLASALASLGGALEVRSVCNGVTDIRRRRTAQTSNPFSNTHSGLSRAIQ